MFVPVILGSDKTTVSVGTGNNEYYPLYLSIGNVSNKARRSQKLNTVQLVAFLAIPKSVCQKLSYSILSNAFFAAERQYEKSDDFRRFRHQIFHSSISRILSSLKTAMSINNEQTILRCPDGHLRRSVLGLGSYIADYPEQVSLCAICTGWCCK